MEELNHDFSDPPEGWRKVVKRRQRGKTAGKLDIYYYNQEGQKFRSRIELEKYLTESGSSLKLDQFNFFVWKESSEVDISSISSSVIIKRSDVQIERKRSKKTSQKFFNDEDSNLPSEDFNIEHSTETFVTDMSPSSTVWRRGVGKGFGSRMTPQKFLNGESASLLSDQFNIQHSTETFVADRSSSSTIKRRGRDRGRGRGSFQSIKTPRKVLNGERASLLLDQFNIQHSTETFAADRSSSSTMKRRGRSRGRKRFGSRKTPRKFLNVESASLLSDQFDLQHNTETSETDNSSTNERRRIGKKLRSKKAPCKYFNDEGSGLPSEQFDIQRITETFVTDISSSSISERSPSLPVSSEVNNEDVMIIEPTSFTSSLERYSDELLFLIPIDQPQHLNQGNEPVSFPNIKNCNGTGVQVAFLATNGS